MPANVLDWRQRNAWIADLLARRTGSDVAAWNARIRDVGFANDSALRAWLTEQGVTGYPQDLLVMEHFGYPAFLIASADELVDAQYADRPALRPIHDALLAAVATLGPVTIQARKSYVSLLTPRRTFAAIQATTRSRVDLGLRLAHPQLGGRLESPGSVGQSAMTARIGLTSIEAVDDEVVGWLRRAYEENL